MVSHMYNIPHGSYSSVALTDTHFASELGSKKGKQLLGRAVIVLVFLFYIINDDQFFFFFYVVYVVGYTYSPIWVSEKERRGVGFPGTACM